MLTKKAGLKTLPSLLAFEDKRVSTGLKFITGGNTYTATAGGQLSDNAGGMDYVADAKNSKGHILTGLCKNHLTSDAFFASQELADWVRVYGDPDPE